MNRYPVWTFGACVAALIAWLFPQTGEWLTLDRQAVLNGQFWRLVTGHLVHFSWSHLLLNITVFAATAGMLETFTPIRRTVLFIVAPTIISLALLFTEPFMSRYGGLSGLETTALIWLTLYSVRFAAPLPRWLATIALGATLIKVACEWSRTTPLFASIAGGAVVAAPMSHVVGGLLAVLFFAATLPEYRRAGRRMV